MTDRTINLDRHRGMAAQKATEMRRLLEEVQANDKALRLRRQELETQLAAAPAARWFEAAAKARYLLNLFASTPGAQDTCTQTLIQNVLEDFRRLSQTEGSDSLKQERKSRFTHTQVRQEDGCGKGPADKQS
jgi:hypothetical protein